MRRLTTVERLKATARGSYRQAMYYAEKSRDGMAHYRSLLSSVGSFEPLADIARQYRSAHQHHLGIAAQAACPERLP